MKMHRFVLALAVTALVGGEIRGDDPDVPKGPVGSRASISPALEDLGTHSAPSASSPFSRGFGQIVSGWTRDGIHGRELADRIPALQLSRPTGRDVRNGSREVRHDLNRPRDNEARAVRDLADLRRDLGRSDRPGDRRPEAGKKDHDGHGWRDRDDHRHDRDVAKRQPDPVARKDDVNKSAGSQAVKKNDPEPSKDQPKTVQPNDPRPVPRNVPPGRGRIRGRGRG